MVRDVSRGKDECRVLMNNWTRS